MSNCNPCEEKKEEEKKCECQCKDTCGDRAIVNDLFKKKGHTDYFSIERRFAQPDECNQLVAKCQKASISEATLEAYIKSLLTNPSSKEIVINTSTGTAISKVETDTKITFTLPASGNASQKKQWFMANHISQNDITFPTNTAFDDIKFGQVKQGDSSTGYGYNPSTGQFKAEYHGLYLFTFNGCVSYTANGSTKSVTGMIYKQSLLNEGVNIYFSDTDVTNVDVSATVQLRLNKGDLVSVRFQKFNAGDTMKILTKSSNEQPYFHGHLIHELPEEISGPLG